MVGAGLDQAEVLDNFIPTAKGARLRGGKQEAADLGAPAIRLFTYQSGSLNKLFASTATEIYDVFDVAGGSLRTSTSGDYSTVQTSTAGGEFLVGVNGSGLGFTYDGTTFSNLTTTMGATSDQFSQVWLFKQRLFFVEKQSQSVWYLATSSISGVATEINLGAVFERGGNLLFGATWSLDSGSGLDDVCVFVSENGELAVYEGTDPSSASTWSLVGVYQIGEPLNKHSFFQAGGDLAIITKDGIVPVSEALQKDRAALQSSAITMRIEDAWKYSIQGKSSAYPVTATLWQSNTLLLVGTGDTDGGSPVSFAANARTGAWGRFTGWDVRCAAVHDNNLYFGENSGKVYRADVGGTDGGDQFTGVYVPKFKYSDSMRSAHHANITYRSVAELTFTVTAFADYSTDDIPPPAPPSFPVGTTWGTGVWGTFVWGNADELQSFSSWHSVSANGYALAPGLAITSNQTEALPFEMLVARLRSETGYPA